MAIDKSGNPIKLTPNHLENHALLSNLSSMAEKYEKLMEKYQVSLKSNDMLSKTIRNQEEIIKSLEVSVSRTKSL